MNATGNIGMRHLYGAVAPRICGSSHFTFIQARGLWYVHIGMRRWVSLNKSMDDVIYIFYSGSLKDFCDLSTGLIRLVMIPVI